MSKEIEYIFFHEKFSKRYHQITKFFITLLHEKKSYIVYTVKYMIYRFTIISDEVDDFIREIKIDSEATFFDLHEAILKAAGYKDDQMTSFFICDDDWEKDQEITLEDMGSSSEEDSYIMRETRLSDLGGRRKAKIAVCIRPAGQNECFSLNYRKSSPAKTLTKQYVRAKLEKPLNKPSTLTK